MSIQAPTSHKTALEQIMKICNESSDYSRRTQAIHEVAMLALGLTYNQRAERHTKALQRSEEYKENRKLLGQNYAKRKHKLDTEAETGETRASFKHQIAEKYS